MQNKLLLGIVILLLMVTGNSLHASMNPVTLTSAGETAFASNDFGQAAENFAGALKYAPENLKVRFRYGQALYSLNRFSESHQQFQTILQNSPNNIIARIYLAENLIQLKRSKEAIEHVAWILKIQPGHERAQQILAQLNSAKVARVAPEKMPDKSQALPVRSAPKSIKNPTNAASGKQPAVVVKSANTPATAPSQVQILPQPSEKITNLDVATFIKAAGHSFLLNLEQAKYCLESGNFVSAREFLDKAEELARNSRDSRRFLEVQILKSLVFVYSLDFKAFGQQLMSLKPILSPESYQSFLDIYNQGADIKEPVEQSRLAAGIAMGAQHHAVACLLLADAYKKHPTDPLIANFLADAQMQNFDYSAAEITLSAIARTDSKSAEAYFNLARFYLTAFYKPQQARDYATYAASLKPDDARISILLALLDYSQGKLTEGMARIKEKVSFVDDPALKNVCEKILADGMAAESLQPAKRTDFARILALPGAPHAPVSSYRIPGEDYLRKGSFFSAMKYFVAANDLAEVGRTYLGLASALNAAGEKQQASLATAYGLQALNQELAAHQQNNRAYLYLALYQFDRGDKIAARRIIEKGLAAGGEPLTRQRLTAMLNAVNNI